MNVGNVNWYFLLTHYNKRVEITEVKPFLAGENTSVLIILATTVDGKTETQFQQPRQL